MPQIELRGLGDGSIVIYRCLDNGDEARASPRLRPVELHHVLETDWSACATQVRVGAASTRFMAVSGPIRNGSVKNSQSATSGPLSYI